MPRAAAVDLGIYNDDTDSAAYAAYRQRVAAPEDQSVQDNLAPLEHEQFTREVTGRNPVQGAAVTLFSSGYSGLKMAADKGVPGARALVNYVGTGEAKTSKASVEEIGGAMTGFGKGLRDYFRKKKK